MPNSLLLKKIFNKTYFKRIFFIIAAIAFHAISRGNSYYFSTSVGNDAYSAVQAQNKSTPWKSIAKLNSFFANFVPGDNIYFERGDTFYGSINISKSGTITNPIFLGAYGTGNQPIITGFTTILNWISEGGGIYSKIISADAQTNMVTINDVQHAMGRYPDAGYLTYKSFSSNISITDNASGSTNNWTNAEVVIRKNDYTITRCLITQQSGGTLTYSSYGSTEVPKSAGFGYFIQNDLRTLTSFGEWYHNKASSKFYMYFGTTFPSAVQVKVATINNLISTSNGADNFTIDNINFTGSIDNLGQFNGNNSNVVIQNCALSFAGKDALYFESDNGSIINNNTINGCNNSGLMCLGVATIITNNTIQNSGTVLGQNLGNDSYNAIFIYGNNAIVKNNIIHKTGASGIVLKYHGASTVQYNIIDSACIFTDDGGGIYTAGPDTGIRLIDHNFISNVIGNSDGTTNNYPISAGIFIDDPGSNITISNNTIYNIAQYAGIKLYRGNNNSILDNTTYNNSMALSFQDGSGNGLYNNIWRRNIFFAKTAMQQTLSISTVTNSITSVGIADSNYYVRPIANNTSLYTNQPSTGGINRTVSSWQSFSNQDWHAQQSPKEIFSESDLNFQINPTAVPKAVSFSGLSYMDAKGNIYNNSISIPAWSSVVLIANGSAPAPPVSSTLLPAVYPANAINGLNYKYYEGNWNVLPDFSSLQSIKSGSGSNFYLSYANRTTQYGLSFTGFINVPADGQYTFFTSSDDGSNLYIDKVLTVQNDGIHAAVEKSGVIGLKAGKHAILVNYFQQMGGVVLSVSYAGAGISKQNIASADLYRVNGTIALVTNNDNLNSLNQKVVKNINATDLFVSNYPNPATNSINVKVEGGTNEKIEISLINSDGKIIYRTNGLSNRIYCFGNYFSQGLYIIRVVQGEIIKNLKQIKL